MQVRYQLRQRPSERDDTTAVPRFSFSTLLQAPCNGRMRGPIAPQDYGAEELTGGPVRSIAPQPLN